MTLVVTEVSDRFGCIVVGDSAVTTTDSSDGTRIVLGANKVQYSDSANIGLAIWGNACLSARRIDHIVADFLNDLACPESPRLIGERLAATLNAAAEKDGRPWKELRGGVHLSGYEGATPILYHVHTGHDPPHPQGPFQLYMDYPNAGCGAQLRNGHYQMFVHLFDGMERYIEGLSELGFDWPNRTTDDRVSFNSMMVNMVSTTLKLAGRLEKVGGEISSLAFNRDGIHSKHLAPRLDLDFCSCRGAAVEFASSAPPAAL